MPENDKFFRSISVSIWHWGMMKKPESQHWLSCFPAFPVRRIRTCYPTDFFIRIFYEKPFNQGLFQKKMRIKFFQVYNEVSKI